MGALSLSLSEPPPCAGSLRRRASERAHWPGLCGGWAHLLCPCRLSVCHVCCVQVPFLCTEAFNAASVTCIMLIAELTLSICQVFFNLFLCVCRFWFFWTAYLRNVDSDLKCLDSMIFLFFYFIVILIIFLFLKAWVCPLNHRLWILQHSLDCFHPLLRAGWKRIRHKIDFVKKKKKRLSGQKCVLLKDKKKINLGTAAAAAARERTHYEMLLQDEQVNWHQ